MNKAFFRLHACSVGDVVAGVPGGSPNTMSTGNFISPKEQGAWGVLGGGVKTRSVSHHHLLQPFLPVRSFSERYMAISSLPKSRTRGVYLVEE